jgi:hypothetical protein
LTIILLEQLVSQEVQASKSVITTCAENRRLQTETTTPQINKPKQNNTNQQRTALLINITIGIIIIVSI